MSMENNFLDKQDDFIDVETPDFQPFVDLKHIYDPSDSEFRPSKIDYDSIGEFCFESEQLALKGNEDYKNLIQRIVVLNAHKARALKDLKELKNMKEKALNDPIQFLDDMKHKRIRFPPRQQRLHPLPAIDWGKYAGSEDPVKFTLRMRQECANSRLQNRQCSSVVSEEIHANSNWSNEELNRLKELLVEYSSEQNEAERWEKVADALRTRTPIEVATRISSYFCEFAENALYSLNKAPDLELLRKIWRLDEMEEKQDMKAHKDDSTTLSDDETFTPELRDTPEYEELLILRKVLRSKLSGSPGRGVSYQCLKRSAGKRPLEHMDNYHESSNTTSSPKKCLMDSDYLRSFTGSSFNYLDPNYLPAT